jgi:hypothetical protein
MPIVHALAHGVVLQRPANPLIDAGRREIDGSSISICFPSALTCAMLPVRRVYGFDPGKNS